MASFKALDSTPSFFFKANIDFRRNWINRVLGLVPYGTGRVGIAAAAFSASALAKSFLPLAAATLLSP
jgi:hypothetical protein